jgi:uncharacterized protein (TIGR02145 family)
MISKKLLPILKTKNLAVFTFAFFLVLALLVQSCKKDKAMVTPADSINATPGETTTNQKRKNPGSEPTPPAQFYFYCADPVMNGSFAAGVPANVTLTLTYYNGTGSPYAAFTSTTVNGITLSSAAGTLNNGTGTVDFVASGTPVNSGFINIPISINGSPLCPLLITISNAPVSGPTADPGLTPGSTGIVNFTYKGQSVAYKTVRAKDGLIWLQQNLGAPQVAFHAMDQACFGDYFQWGRWDDGHQTPNSSAITGGSTLMNPSHISSGNTNFIKGTTAGTRWWGTGGTLSDSWSGTTISSTNGKDPCAALGTGWRLPTAAEWQTVNLAEDLGGTIAAYGSNLKLPASGYRYSSDGSVYAYNGDFGYYWSSTADANSTAKVFAFDNLYNGAVAATNRAEGFSCRCVKQ